MAKTSLYMRQYRARIKATRLAQPAPAAPTPPPARAAAVGGGGGGAGGPVFTLPQNPNNQDWANMTDVAATLLRRQMGQTGNEAGQNRRFRGDPNTTYVQSSKSYLVNNLLTNDLKSFDGYKDSGADNWLRTGYNKQDAIATIRQMDAGMKPLTQDTRLVRYVGGGDGGVYELSSILGKNVSAAVLRGMPADKLNNLFTGQSKDFKTYLSTSWRMDKNNQRDAQYMSYPIRKEYSVQAGVHAIVTNNVGEHEIVLGRGYTERYTGARFDGKQLVISVSIEKDGRKGYYKV